MGFARTFIWKASNYSIYSRSSFNLTNKYPFTIHLSQYTTKLLRFFMDLFQLCLLIVAVILLPYAKVVLMLLGHINQPIKVILNRRFNQFIACPRSLTLLPCIASKLQLAYCTNLDILPWELLFSLFIILFFFILFIFFILLGFISLLQLIHPLTSSPHRAKLPIRTNIWAQLLNCQ